MVHEIFTKYLLNALEISCWLVYVKLLSIIEKGTEFKDDSKILGFW